MFICPVIQTGLAGQKDREVSRVTGVVIAAHGVLPEGMDETDSLGHPLRGRFVQAREKKSQKSRVIAQGQLACIAVGFKQILAETAIIAAVEGDFPHPQLLFIDHYISKHC